MKTSKETSLSLLPDPECPKYGPTGPKMGKHRLKIAFWPHKSAHRAYWGWKGWNKVGTPMKASIQTSLAHLSHLECPKCGQKAIFRLFGPFLVPIGPHFGYSWCDKRPKLVCLDVFIGIPTLLRPFQLGIGHLDHFFRPKGFLKLILVPFRPP